MHDGVLFAVLLNTLEPGAMGLKRISMDPKNTEEKLQNVELVLDAVATIDPTSRKITKTDIVNESKESILALTWLIIIRHYMGNRLSGTGIHELTPEYILV